jgi:hypothetical protein
MITIVLRIKELVCINKKISFSFSGPSSLLKKDKKYAAINFNPKSFPIALFYTSSFISGRIIHQQNICVNQNRIKIFL